MHPGLTLSCRTQEQGWGWGGGGGEGKSRVENTNHPPNKIAKKKKCSGNFGFDVNSVKHDLDGVRPPFILGHGRSCPRPYVKAGIWLRAWAGGPPVAVLVYDRSWAPRVQGSEGRGGTSGGGRAGCLWEAQGSFVRKNAANTLMLAGYTPPVSTVVPKSPFSLPRGVT